MAIDVPALEDAILGALHTTIAEVNPTCHANVTLDSSLERDLGLDSLVRAELLMRRDGPAGMAIGKVSGSTGWCLDLVWAHRPVAAG